VQRRTTRAVLGRRKESQCVSARPHHPVSGRPRAAVQSQARRNRRSGDGIRSRTSRYSST